MNRTHKIKLKILTHASVNPTAETNAFTLVELLVVIAIISVLAGIALPVFGSMQATGKKGVSLANMRQLGVGALQFIGDQDGLLPFDKSGGSTDSWNEVGNSTNPDIALTWYNAIPATIGKRTAGDYASNKKAFYDKDSLFFCPSAKYPANAASQSSPVFGMVMNSKLIGKVSGVPVRTRLCNIQSPSKTVFFLESGISGEIKTYSTQSSYNGQPAAFASRFIARYDKKESATNSEKDNNRGIVTFLDGHAEIVAAKDVVDKSTGKAYLPQSNGKVVWTPDPTVDANL